jgi:hypothetical protein
LFKNKKIKAISFYKMMRLNNKLFSKSQQKMGEEELKKLITINYNKMPIK